MQATGIVRCVDDLGRIVLPKNVRQKFAIKEGTKLELFLTKDGILLKRYCPEADLSYLTNLVMDSVTDLRTDLGPERIRAMQQHVQALQELLKQKR